MPIQEDPIVGTFYEDPDGLTFEVTAFDEDEGAIEVRYDDGSVDEIGIDTWYEMELRRVEGHEAGPGDDDEDEDEEERPGRAADDYDEADDEDDYDDEEEA
jgi:hypothetical protein